MIGVTEFEELPQNQVGSARASALATIDRRHDCNAVIIADLSNDASYADNFLETFGRRVTRLRGRVDAIAIGPRYRSSTNIFRDLDRQERSRVLDSVL